MLYRESETVELKREVTDDIKKEMLAFVNTDGGTLYIGVTDSGEVVGLPNPKDTQLQVNNMLRDTIKPDVMMFVQSRLEDVQGKQILAVTAQRGTERPYYLAGKGLRPEGVFIRQGTASVPATETAIRRLIKETDGDSYEVTRAMQQDMTFEAAGAEFAQRDLEFGEAQKMTLGLLNSDKIFTNLGLLLSDQCPHTIKVAVFQDHTQMAFKDRREFGGSLFRQLNDAYTFIDLHNQINSTFQGLKRIDSRDYPEEAVREGLLNAITHREYAQGASTLIKLFSDRMEFISMGGLVNGIALEDIMSGYSVCRNPELAGVFYRLQLIEAYGTGMMKIFESYRVRGKEPKIEVTPNVFKLILPNLNAEAPALSADVEGVGMEEQAMRFATQAGIFSRKELEARLGISQSYAVAILKQLMESGRLAKEGNGKNVRYRVNK